MIKATQTQPQLTGGRSPLNRPSAIRIDL